MTPFVVMDFNYQNMMIFDDRLYGSQCYGLLIIYKPPNPVMTLVHQGSNDVTI
jgi:hypothetical protein